MICIGCGCDEHHACTLPGGEPCAWIHVGPKGLAGICSACVEIYSPSEIEPELNHAEASLEIALGDPDSPEQPVGIIGGDDPLDDMGAGEGGPPALSFLDPPDNIPAGDFLPHKIRSEFGPMLECDRQRYEFALTAPDADRRLILPGDEEFHL